jgi:hypothetical protein
MALPKAIQTARLFLASEHPYVAGVLWNLRPVEKPGIATLGVDEHWRLYYDPAIESKWTEEEITGVLFHEVNHILRDHVLEHRAKPFMHCFPSMPSVGTGQVTPRSIPASRSWGSSYLKKVSFLASLAYPMACWLRSISTSSSNRNSRLLQAGVTDASPARARARASTRTFT